MSIRINVHGAVTDTLTDKDGLTATDAGRLAEHLVRAMTSSGEKPVMVEIRVFPAADE